jgi:hypothetical protein
MDKIKVRWLFERSIDAISLTLAILAMTFAFVQFLDSRDQLKKLKELTNSITTRYKATFPDNLAYIVPVIDNAVQGSEVDVMTDHAGYAIYSRPDEFRKYRRSLEDTVGKKKASVKLLVYNRKVAHTALEFQFSDSDFRTESKANFHDFFVNLPPAPTSREEFMNKILDLQDETIHQFCMNGIQVRRVPQSQKFLFFLWLNKKPEAIFAFRNEAERMREITFYSVDPDLIQIFNTIFEQTWKAVDPSTDHELAAEEDVACRNLRAGHL